MMLSFLGIRYGSLLNYTDDDSRRSYVIKWALNRGEAYHQLCRAIASVNGNRFWGLLDYVISLWNQCARLLTNVIINWRRKKAMNYKAGVAGGLA